jgi:hypothetical protein
MVVVDGGGWMRTQGGAFTTEGTEEHRGKQDLRDVNAP